MLQPDEQLESALGTSSSLTKMGLLRLPTPILSTLNFLVSRDFVLTSKGETYICSGLFSPSLSQVTHWFLILALKKATIGHICHQGWHNAKLWFLLCSPHLQRLESFSNS
jgi:hypothetical protein